MSGVRISLKGFAGYPIEQVLTDACAVAKRCGCWATIDINGIDVLISPTDEGPALWSNYCKARDRGATFVSANVIPNPPAGRSLAAMTKEAD